MSRKAPKIELSEEDTRKGIKNLNKTAYISLERGTWYLIDPSDSDAIEAALTDGFAGDAEISLELAEKRNGEGTGVSHEISMKAIVSKLIGRNL